MHSHTHTHSHNRSKSVEFTVPLYVYALKVSFSFMQTAQNECNTSEHADKTPYTTSQFSFSSIYHQFCVCIRTFCLQWMANLLEKNAEIDTTKKMLHSKERKCANFSHCFVRFVWLSLWLVVESLSPHLKLHTAILSFNAQRRRNCTKRHSRTQTKVINNTLGESKTDYVLSFSILSFGPFLNRPEQWTMQNDNNKTCTNANN